MTLFHSQLEQQTKSNLNSQDKSQLSSNNATALKYGNSHSVDFPNGGELTSPDGNIINIPMNSSMNIPSEYGYIKYKYAPIVISKHISKSYLLFIPVIYKGKSYQFLMDTGSPYSNIPFLNTRNNNMHIINQSGHIYTTTSHIYLGDMNISPYLKIQNISTKNQHFPMIIGRDVLSHFSIQINLRKHKIVLWPKGLPYGYEPRSLNTTSMMNLAVKSTLSLIHLNYSTSQQAYLFSALINRTKFKLYYDSGSNITTVLNVSQNIGKFVKTSHIYTPYGTYTCNLFITHVLLNNLDIKDGIVGLLNVHNPSNSDVNTSGNLLFLNYNIWIDFHDQMLLIIPYTKSFFTIFKQNLNSIGRPK
ncbi:hypothetical protein [Ferroplasma sp.]|uniref:hypothetical protein n=1 Tax=Ferroplasma sp. TaxID=2591003 RepID=UPI002632478C|nr:hypothetical protein [Ferroplasma sp.]